MEVEWDGMGGQVVGFASQKDKDGFRIGYIRLVKHDCPSSRFPSAPRAKPYSNNTKKQITPKQPP